MFFDSQCIGYISPHTHAWTKTNTQDFSDCTANCCSHTLRLHPSCTSVTKHVSILLLPVSRSSETPLYPTFNRWSHVQQMKPVMLLLMFDYVHWSYVRKIDLKNLRVMSFYLSTKVCVLHPWQWHPMLMLMKPAWSTMLLLMCLVPSVMKALLWGMILKVTVM